MQPIQTSLPDYVLLGAVKANDLSVTAAQAFFPSGSQLAFTPSVEYLLFTFDDTSDPDNPVAIHQTIYLDPFVASVDAEGVLIDPFGRPLMMVANVGQTKNSATWNWSCTPKINGKQRPKFKLDVTADTDTWIADQMQVA